MKLKDIPKTSVVCYISGLHSLNLDLKYGTGHDWHFMNYWVGGKVPVKLYGKGQEIDTNHIYGYYGVANREQVFRELGYETDAIYVADHHRAILDLVYESLTKFGMIGYAKGCVEDYFFEEHHSVELFVQLLRMREFLEDDTEEILVEWLSKEFRPIYRSWKFGKLQVGALASYGANFV